MEEVDRYGSDAFRLGIVTGESPASNRPFDRSKLVGARNFCNKLWNVARFIEDKIGDTKVRPSAPKPQSEADHWLLSKLHQAVASMSLHLDEYRFSEASDIVYHLVWDDVADWYIEASKSTPNLDMLAYCLETILKLAHPFTPFVTETIWQTLTWSGDTLLAVSSWPKNIPAYNKKRAAAFEELRTVVTEVRYIKSVMKLNGLTLYHRGEAFLRDHAALIKQLTRLNAVEDVESGQGLRLTDTKFDCWLDVDTQTAKEYVTKIADKIQQTKASIAQLEGRLSNKNYVDKAPKHLVEETRAQLKEAQAQAEKLQTEYERFSKAN